MRKISTIIVDDFAPDREWLVTLLREGKLFRHIDIVGEFASGKEALEGIRALRPDLVISDIEMPGMNGFDLARELKMTLPETKIIFCTVHDKFEFVRRVLYLGGYGYLLKPVKEEDIQPALLLAEAALAREGNQDKEQQQLEELRRIWDSHRPLVAEVLLKEALYGYREGDVDLREALALLHNGPTVGDLATIQLLVVETDDFERLTHQYSFARKQLLSHRVLQSVRDALAPFGAKASVVRIDDSRTAILCALGPEDDSGETSKEGCDRLRDAFAYSDISLTIAVSDRTDRWGALPQLFEQCLQTLKYKYSIGKGKVLYSSDFPYQGLPFQPDFGSMQKDLTYLLHAGDDAQIREYVGQQFEAIPDSTSNDNYRSVCLGIVFHVHLVILNAGLPLAESIGDRSFSWEQLHWLETAEDVEAWLLERLLAVHERLTSQESSRNQALTDKIRQWIEEHLHEAVSLESLSRELHYSPNYLNHIFKKETGRTIFDCLLDIRMEKAKVLLADERLKLYEVANRVGYTHTAYFGKLFKNHTGLSPAEYRIKGMSL